MFAEWNSKKKTLQFVAFDKKVFQYPRIVARAQGKKIDLSGCKAAHDIANGGKELRDALVHPTPFIDPKSKQKTKFFNVTGTMRVPVVEGLLESAKEYVRTVEIGLGNDPTKTAPWLERTSKPRIGVALVGDSYRQTNALWES